MSVNLKARKTICLTLFFLSVTVCFSQKMINRAQYPDLLENAYFEANVGYIHYPFTLKNLEPGFQGDRVIIPRPAVRLVLFGYRFNKYLSGQITYMRPVNWVQFENINGNQQRHSVWMNIGGISLKSQYPLLKRLSIYGEAGFALITRNGFEIDGRPVVRNATFGNALLGSGLRFHLNEKWMLNAGITYSPRNSHAGQPHSSFISTGFTYQMKRLPDETARLNATNGFHYPKQLLQIGYVTNALGYGVNHFFADGKIPIFWGGVSAIKSGLAIHYQRNYFHTRKVFSFDLGASLSYYRSNLNDEDIITASVYPLLRFTALRTRSFDLFFNYSVAGPAFISRTRIDSIQNGRRFTFQDFMGMGIFSGKDRRFNAELRIAHYSNGNIFSQNEGVKIPLTIHAGITF